MTESAMQEIVTAAEALGLNITAYPDYSGRGMYGDKTCGVVIKNVGDLLVAVCEAVRNHDDPDDFVEDIRCVKTDSMGRDMIVY